jgi:hypothetical protein
VASQNPVLAMAFQASEMIAALSETYKTPPDYLRGERWRAIRHICTEGNITEMGGLVESAIKVQFLPHEAPTQDLVEALKLVSHAMTLSKKVAAQVGGTQIFQLLLGMLVQFDTASMLHAAIREFTLASLRQPTLGGRVASVMLPFIMTEALLHDYGIVSATCWALIDAIDTEMTKGTITTSALSRNAEFNAFATENLAEYRERLARDYGGRARGFPQRPQDLITARMSELGHTHIDPG